MEEPYLKVTFFPLDLHLSYKEPEEEQLNSSLSGDRQKKKPLFPGRQIRNISLEEKYETNFSPESYTETPLGYN